MLHTTVPPNIWRNTDERRVSLVTAPPEELTSAISNHEGLARLQFVQIGQVSAMNSGCLGLPGTSSVRGPIHKLKVLRTYVITRSLSLQALSPALDERTRPAVIAASLIISHPFACTFWPPHSRSRSHWKSAMQYLLVRPAR